MKSHTNQQHQVRNRVLAGLALAGTMAVSAPATPAQAVDMTALPASEVQTTDSAQTTSTTTKQTAKQTEQATKQTAKVPFIDNSTAGNPNKALLHCINMYTKEAMQDVLVDYTYGVEIAGQTYYNYKKPVIDGYTSAGYYPDGGDVRFTTTTPGMTIEFKVNYRTTASDASIYSWVQENGVWYYRCGAGINFHGWLNKDGKYYFLDKTTGAMQTGWVKDGGNWYYMYSNGQMASNTTIDGYTLDSNGVCK